METWIKLYRKLIGHDVLRDSTSIQIFIWILLSVDYSSGEMICGRFWASQQLGMNPNTFYKSLKRLEKKYDLVTLSSNNKNTIILVKNWSKYQSDGNTISNNKVTTKEQQSNNKVTLINNIRNKELINNKIDSPLKGKHLPKNDELSQSDFEEIAEKYQVPLGFVLSKWEDVINYCHSNNKKYSDFKRTLMNFVKKDALKIRKEHNEQRQSKSSIAYYED